MPWAAAILVGAGALLAVLGARAVARPPTIRKPVLVGLAFVVFFGVFQELIQIMMQFGDVDRRAARVALHLGGLTPEGRAGHLRPCGRRAAPALDDVAARAGESGRPLTPARAAPSSARRVIILVVAASRVFPIVAGSYIGQVMMLVGLYILMGMGLNLEVGLAGLLDLGFVAFFAVGAYTTALLTADSPHALAAYTALPEPLLSGRRCRSPSCARSSSASCSAFPVLGVRGDYLAVATMGLGEIVRVDRAIGRGGAAARAARRAFCRSRSRGSAASSSATPSRCSI